MAGVGADCSGTGAGADAGICVGVCADGAGTGGGIGAGAGRGTGGGDSLITALVSGSAEIVKGALGAAATGIGGGLTAGVDACGIGGGVADDTATPFCGAPQNGQKTSSPFNASRHFPHRNCISYAAFGGGGINGGGGAVDTANSGSCVNGVHAASPSRHAIVSAGICLAANHCVMCAAGCGPVWAPFTNK